MTRRWFNGLTFTALLMTIGIMALGAFVRLSDAGLGCPDWPTCYGHVLWPQTAIETAVANEGFHLTPVENQKTWPEQVHRLFASSLGFVTLVLFIGAFRQSNHTVCRRFCLGAVMSAQVMLIIRLVLSRYWVVTDKPQFDEFDPLIAGCCLMLLVAVVVRLFVSTEKKLLLTTLAVVMVVLQGLFGMWTVTLKLWPQVVTLHLLGGMCLAIMFCLLALTNIRRLNTLAAYSSASISAWLRYLAPISLLVVLVQILLGGWVSANYAAVACADFPTCQGSFWPDVDFKQGFTVFQEIGPNYLGGQLHSDARAAIHILHRLGALVVTIICTWFFISLWRVSQRSNRHMAVIGLGLLLIQILLGIANVLLQFPMAIAILHNLFAALLLLSVVSANYWIFNQKVAVLRSRYA